MHAELLHVLLSFLQTQTNDGLAEGDDGFILDLPTQQEHVAFMKYVPSSCSKLRLITLRCRSFADCPSDREEPYLHCNGVDGLPDQTRAFAKALVMVRFVSEVSHLSWNSVRYRSNLKQ